MDAAFWRERWQSDRIAFHEGRPNAMLTVHLERLGLAEGARVFVPMCGKTRDIAWLLSRGHRVAGAELHGPAVEQLFEDLGVTPEVTEVEGSAVYRADGVDIHQGDIFALTAEALGVVDATYDRAALVALPEAMRARYARHLVDITRGAPQLLISFDYDQTQMDGPPFSVDEDEVRRLYARGYAVTPLASEEVAGGLKGECAATENAWWLRAR